MKITKSGLVEQYAQKHNSTKKDAAEIIDNVFNLLQDNFIEGNDVELQNIGTLKIKERPARMGRNPKTGEPMQFTDSKSIVFKINSGLKKKLI